MRRSHLLPAIVIGTTLCAAPVTIRVEAPDYAGKHIRLYAYSDYFTLRTTLLAEGDVDGNGAVTLNADVDGTRKAVLRIGPVGADLYLRGGNYHVRIPAPPPGQVLPWGGTTRVDPEFLDLDALDVNALMTDLNERLDAFVAQDLAMDNDAGMAEVAKVRAGEVKPAADSTKGPRTLFTGPQWSLARTDTFARKLRKFYAGVRDPWFQSNVEYGLAGTYLGPRTDDRQLFERYIAGRPILYDVPEYVRFFNNLFEGYLMRAGYAKNPDAFVAWVRTGATDSLKAALRRNEFLRDDRVNELVLIAGLYDRSGKKEFDRNGVLAVLKDVRARSAFAEHRAIAEDMVQDLTAMGVGERLPPLPLRTATGEAADLSETPEGPACLFITTPRCTYCDEEFSALAQLYKEYGAYVTFIGILAPANEADLSAWAKEHPGMEGATWYATTRTNELQEQLRSKSVPALYLLQDGVLTASPGPLPSRGLKAVLYTIKAKADAERRLKPDRGLPPPKR